MSSTERHNSEEHVECTTGAIGILQLTSQRQTYTFSLVHSVHALRHLLPIPVYHALYHPLERFLSCLDHFQLLPQVCSQRLCPLCIILCSLPLLSVAGAVRFEPCNVRFVCCTGCFHAHRNYCFHLLTACCELALQSGVGGVEELFRLTGPLPSCVALAP